VVLAVSDEGEDLVSKYVDDMGITGVRVGAGFTGGEAWGVRGYPSAAMIAPDGTVAWTGHPSELTSSKVKKLLKDAKPSKGGYLAYPLGREVGPALSSAVKAAEEGKLGKAILAARDAAADESLDASAREEAAAVAAEYEAHAELLLGQAESLIEKRAMVRGVQVYGELAKALDDTDHGQRAARRLAEIEKDDSLQEELAADEAYAKAMEAVARRGTKKAVPKFEAIVKKYGSTAAAGRARKWLAKN
jgi:hypothetical protein